MHTHGARYLSAASVRAAIALWAAPLAVAQAQSSPFLTGATALQTNLLAWLTPIAMHLKMEQRGLRSGLAERLRAEYRERVARRLERAAAHEATAAIAVGEKRSVEVTAGPAVGSSDVQEVRRRAREAWLQLRSAGQQAGNAQTLAKGQAAEQETRGDEATPSRPGQNDFAL